MLLLYIATLSLLTTDFLCQTAGNKYGTFYAVTKERFDIDENQQRYH